MSNIDFDKIKRDFPLPDVAAQSGLKLEKNGSEFLACCPFHGEKTPSFSLYNSEKGWKFFCFGCGVYGDVIDFVKDRYGYATNSEALKFFLGEKQERPRPLTSAEFKEANNPYDGYNFSKPPADMAEIVAGVRSPSILNPKRLNPTTKKPVVTSYRPSMVFPYRTRKGDLLGYVFRVDFDEGRKITPGVWWMTNRKLNFSGWSHGSYPSLRPLYNLHLLEKHPTAQVLLVEGEKCADAGNRLFRKAGLNVVAITWMGGGKSVDKTYWESLKGRSILIWPDNDEEGERTVMGFARPGGSWYQGIIERLHAIEAARVKVIHISPDSREEGWDIADAEKELPPEAIFLIMRTQTQEWSQDRFREWKLNRIDAAMPQSTRLPETDSSIVGLGRGNHSEPEEEVAPASEEQQSPDPEESEDAEEDEQETLPTAIGRGYGVNEDTWRNHLVMKADGDGLKPTSIVNIGLIIQYSDMFRGIFSWNSFAQDVYLSRRPPWVHDKGRPSSWRPRKLIETDVVSCTGFLEYSGMTPRMNDVGRVIMTVAEYNKYNPVVQEIESLKWDGVKRINGDGRVCRPWMSEYLGAEDTEINQIFGERWLIGAIARAMRPGCKMDTMLILEGRQGLQKSTALRALSDGLMKGIFTDEMSDPNSKDAALQMQGMWIIEIGEMDAFRKAEVTQIKSWLARTEDRFRRPYGKIVETFPRTCVFAGSVNPLGKTGYLKDATGGRRFWPVACTEIDIDAIKSDARQLWAEAYELFKAGQKWWLSREEDELAGAVQRSRYEHDPIGELIDGIAAGQWQVPLQMILEQLDIPKERRGGMMAKRIAAHMTIRGWEATTVGDRVVFQMQSRREPVKKRDPQADDLPYGH